MVLLLNLVLLLGIVKLGFFFPHLLLDHACVPNSEIVIGTLGNFLTKFLQALSWRAKLSNLLNFEAFCLFFHVL